MLSIASRFLLALAVAALAGGAAAQDKKDFQPQIGQQGKDVIWVPTPDEIVERMLRMAQTTANDYVMDLGAGDGRIAIAAAKKFGARSTGIEYNPDMVRLAQRNAEKEGVAGKAKFMQADIFATDFSQATVLTMYLLPNLNLKLRPTILAMKPGTRVVSHSFNMEDWQPDETSSLDGRNAYLWIVPANVGGGWKAALNNQSYELSFDQRYQKIEGTIRLGALSAGLREPQLSGFSIRFAYVDNAGTRHQFTGRVTGVRMEGSVRSDDGKEARWSAEKK
ncbi:MAG: class I SAM-dependent methyltransferase [Betaproteobacteria bacterium]|nr:class I SAM-dependent methyltransferase [Betaproteobacteria bacterium]